MTVCIAAIGTWMPAPPAPPEPVVILADDRMITVKDVREYELSDQTKTYALSDRMRVLVAGNGEVLLEICQAVHREMLRDGIMNVATAAKLLAAEFSRVRTERNERRVLSPYNLTFETFHARQQQFSPEFIKRIDEDLRNWRRADLGAEAIVAGVDDEGGHIYIVNDPGQEECCNAAGFAAIGIGTDHAEAEFMNARYTQNWPWTHSVVLTYASKKRAEVAPGVGWATDLYYISKGGGVAYFDPSSPLQNFLAGVYNERRQEEMKGLYEDHLKLLKFMEDNRTEREAAQKAAAQLTVGQATDQEGGPDGTGEGEPEG